ncbi:hypothetical protein ACK3TF_003607 [Chlorella vulgaris]
MHRQQPIAGFAAATRASAVSVPPANAELDSIDLLLGAGSSAPKAGSRPYTAPRGPLSAIHGPRTAPQPVQAPLFADDESLPLPSDETGSAAASPTAAAALGLAAPSSSATARSVSQPDALHLQYSPQQLHVNRTYQSRPASAAVPDAPDASIGKLPVQQQPHAHGPAASVAAQPAPPQSVTQQQAQQAQQLASLQAQVTQLEQQLQDAAQRCTRAEGGEANARHLLAEAQAEVAALQQRLESTNEAAVEQMLAEVERLAAGKQQAGKTATRVEQQLQQAEADRAGLQQQIGRVLEELAAAQRQFAGSQSCTKELQAQVQQLDEELHTLRREAAVAETAAAQAALAQQRLQEHEADLASSTQQVEALAKQLAAAEAEAASNAGTAAKALGQQREAEAGAAALQAQLERTRGQLEECKQHLASGQQILREFEGHLRTVAGERDAAIEQLEHVEERREEAERRLREAERQEAYNARRQADLDGLQAEADGVVVHLREQQRGLAAREREAAGREKQLALRERDADARDSVLQERQEDLAKQEEAASALRNRVLLQQQEGERVRAQLNQQAKALEAAQAQASVALVLCFKAILNQRPRGALHTSCKASAEIMQLDRDQASLAHERGLLDELRTQRMAEQEALLSKLAQERTAAARQQSSAERAVDAAWGAELEASTLLADLQSQASQAKQSADAAQQRLTKVRERCAAEEARLAALQAAVLEQRQGFDAQVRALLELGQQVKGQSEQLSATHKRLQEAQEGLDKQQREVEEQQQEADTRIKAAASQQAEAEAAARKAAEAQLAATAEQRKLGQERLESLRAAEVTRSLQLALAAHVRAAVAAQVPHAAEVWQQLEAALGTAPKVAADGSPAPGAVGVTPAEQGRPQEMVPQVPHVLAPLPLPAGTSPTAGAVVPAAALSWTPAATFPPFPCSTFSAATVPVPPLSGTQDTLRYRSLLASLEGSIERWREQLRAGQPLTLGSAGLASTPGAGLLGYAPTSLGGASFLLPQQAAAAPLGSGHLQAAADRHSLEAGRQSQPQLIQSEPAGEQQGQRRSHHSQDGAAVNEVERSAEDVAPCNPSRGAQTTFSSLSDTPKAGDGVPSSAPSSFAPRCRGSSGSNGSSGSRPSGVRRPSSASAAGMEQSAASPRHSLGSSFAVRSGDVRAVHGLTIPASFSLPGSPQHDTPRKWLKFKASPAGISMQPILMQGGEEAVGGTSNPTSKAGGWGGIFAIRRSVDGNGR